MKLLEMNHIKKEFDGLHVLKDISFSVEEGEVVSIIGPSGSGKSTLLRCATLLEKMDGGELIYMGEKAAKEENGNCVYASKADLKRIHSYFGLVFQNFNLFPHYTVMKNITDALIRIDKVPKKEAEERASELLEQLGLADKKDAYPYQLSGGQQQRVSIARALAKQPKILFFDEPTSALDPELTVEVLKVIKELAKKEEIKAGVVLSAVGCVLKGRVRNAGATAILDIPEHCEIVSLNGTVSTSRTHLHIALTKADLSAVGGHLTEGCIIDTTCELVIMEIPDMEIHTEFDETTGYDELIFQNTAT